MPLPARFAGLPVRADPEIVTTAAPVPPAATPHTAKAAIRFGTRFIHGEGTPLEFLSVECRNRPLGFVVIAHFYERESARLARVTVRHNSHLRDVAELCEVYAQRVFSGLEREVPHKKVLHHFSYERT